MYNFREKSEGVSLFLEILRLQQGEKKHVKPKVEREQQRFVINIEEKSIEKKEEKKEQCLTSRSSTGAPIGDTVN